MLIFALRQTDNPRQSMIDFQNQNCCFPSLDLEKTRGWLDAVAAMHGRRVGRICYCFCSDDDILDANREFLNHDYFTDVITFDNSRGSTINGDVLISVDTVRTNAASLGVTFDEELNRVIVHGVLHLCGINDKAPGERAVMESEENKALALLASML